MLQTNLIFGIQKKIKEGKTQTASGMLEESTTEVPSVPEERAQLIMEGSLNTGIYQQTHSAKKKIVTRSKLVTEAFNMHKVQKKLNKDISFFNYLYENFADKNLQDNFSILLESIFEDTIRLYQECDVTPRLISPALDSNEITESIVIDLYKNALNESIKNNYTKPMLTGKINELYESQIRDFTKKLIQEGSEINMESVRTYLPFEESVYSFIREVVIPKNANTRIQEFIESTDAEYTDFLEESAEEILNKLEKKIKLMASLIGPNMFDKAVEAEGVNAPKMAGISIVVDKNFEDPDVIGDCDEDDICPATVAATDPEANEEMEAENEADEIDSDNDIAKAEEEAREDLDVANDVDDLEEPEAEEDAEESAAEETAEHPEQPGAIELDLPLENGDSEAENGMVVNKSDVGLQGDGNDDGEDLGIGAELPGGASEGDNIEPDETDDAIEDMLSNEDVSEESPEEDKEEELVETKK